VGPQGQTPLHACWDRHDRLSVTSALTVSPVSQRLGLYFSLASSHVTGSDVVAFVRHLRGHLQRPLLVIWDRCTGHKKATRLLKHISGARIPIAALPAYAPELHPVEYCWSHTKYGGLANFIPHDVTHLADEVARSLLAQPQRPALLRAFFQHARLDL
jgi:putative transposase